MKRFVLALTVLYSSPLYAAQPDAVWITHSPREEISPKFELKNGVFKIDASGRNGAVGQWQTRLTVKGGQHYRFLARRSTHAIENPWLYLRECKQITDVGLKEVAKLHQLTELNLSWCKRITDAGVAELRKALPKCRIIHFY